MSQNEEIRAELKPGDSLQNGKYTIEKIIGQGGFGITYYAKHNELNQYYAIKEFFISGFCVRNTYHNTVNVQNDKVDMYDKYKQRFIEEAQMIAKLNHPHIVRATDVFTENNTAYYVMPFIKGKTLQQLVETNGKMSYELAVNYIAQIAEALGYIHERNLLHRDIKPDNVMVTPENSVILIDFGSAREFVQDKTQSHTSILTKGYAPLEQYSNIGKKGAYSDIYSLGAVFYFLVTGQKPLDATERTMEKMKTPKELEPAIPEEINRTIVKAMWLKAEGRHQTIQEFMDDLLNVQPSEPIDESKIDADIAAAQKILNQRQKTLKIVKGVAITAVALVALFFIGRYIANIPPSYNGLTDDIEMVWVKGGEFDMGVGRDKDSDAYPRHKVELDGFYISKYEITQRQWKNIMGEDNNPSEHVGDDLPVENVSWNDAMDFVNKLRQHYGGTYSLPTEAEWEYAARGGVKYNSQKRTRYAGSNDLNTVAWYYDNCEETQPVGTKQPNQLGIYDMNGNVSEWCFDWYDNEYYAKSPTHNPCNKQQNEDENFKVMRGFSYYNDEDEVSCTARDYNSYSSSDEGWGFRIVLRHK